MCSNCRKLGVSNPAYSHTLRSNPNERNQDNPVLALDAFSFLKEYTMGNEITTTSSLRNTLIIKNINIQDTQIYMIYTMQISEILVPTSTFPQYEWMLVYIHVFLHVCKQRDFSYCACAS